jgi:hypothetical protein
MNVHPQSRLPVVLALCCPLIAAAAETPAKHPYYLHALSDLRSAYALVQHRPGDMAVNGRESVALNEISDAIKDIRQGAIDDGRDLNDHPPVDVSSDHSGALHEADELLNKARNDVKKDEDDKAAQGLQQRSLDHIDRAHTAIEAAISDVQKKK